MVEKKIEDLVLTAQWIEITEHFVYQKLSQSSMGPHNKSVLKQISDDELKHYKQVEPMEILSYFKNIRDNIWDKAHGEGRRKGSGDL